MKIAKLFYGARAGSAGRGFCLFWAFILAALTLAPAAGNSAFAQDETPQLVIVSPHWEGIRKEFERGFNRWYKAQYGVEVEMKWLDQGGSADNLKFIESRFAKEPDGIGVDLFFGGGVEPYRKLKSEGLLKAYKPAAQVLDRIPKELNGMALYDPDFTWFGATLTGFGILQNKKVSGLMKQPQAKNWSDLADPALAGWVGSADPRHSGSSHMMYEIMLQALGWEKGWETITGLGANVKGFTQSSSQPVNDAVAGDLSYALAIDFYAYSAIEKAPKGALDYIFPEEASIITADPIAILKGAPHYETAKRFLFYTLSMQGQKLWMYRLNVPSGPEEFALNRLGIVPELYEQPEEKLAVNFNPFSAGGKGIAFNEELSSKRYTILNDLLGAVIIDPQNELKDALKKRGQGALPELAKPPMTEGELLALADRWEDDPAFRNEKISEWIDFARAKYK